MVLSRSIFEYDEKVLIEKLKVRPPLRYEAAFHHSGCFIYYKERGPKLLSSESNVQLKGGEAVLLQCGIHFLDLLDTEKEEPIDVIIFHLYPEILKKIFSGELPKLIENRNMGKQSQVISSNDVVGRFVESLEFYFCNPSLVNNDLLELKIKELVLLLIQLRNVESVLELISGLYNPKTVHIKKVIELHLFSDLKLDQLAKLCNLSLTSFKRKFKSIYGDSPTHYINRRRLEKAKKLLKDSDLNISEIAYMTGFQDPLYFSRLFKNKMGVTPSHFRKGFKI